jgi:hypothetical protein
LVDKRTRWILQRRAYLIVLSIYYFEYVKAAVLDTVNAAHPNAGPRKKAPIISLNSALNYLVADGVFDTQERDELLALGRLRNDVVHRIHNTISGLIPAQAGPYAASLRPTADLEAPLVRLRLFADQIGPRLRTRYKPVFSMTPFLFHAGRTVYEDALVRLDKKIQRSEQPNQ